MCEKARKSLRGKSHNSSLTKVRRCSRATFKLLLRSFLCQIILCFAGLYKIGSRNHKTLNNKSIENIYLRVHFNNKVFRSVSHVDCAGKTLLLLHISTFLTSQQQHLSHQMQNITLTLTSIVALLS